jgi:hypothetical protein
LHEVVEEEMEEEEAPKVEPFGASRGLFHCFQKWYGLKK